MPANPTFQEIIDAALKTPRDASYGVREAVHAVPLGECNHSWAIDTIRKNSLLTDNHVIMGFGGLFIFDLAAESNPPPAGILLCDINSNQAIFWKAFLSLVKECETAANLRQRFSALPETRKDIDFRYTAKIRAARRRENEIDVEWIYDENKYKKIRTMVLEGKVANITLNCMDEKRYKVLKRMLEDKNNNFSVSALYLSNIFKYLLQSPEGFYHLPTKLSKQETIRIFWENQLSLCNDKTVIIDAEPRAHSIRDVIQTYTPQTVREHFLGMGLAV